MTTGGDDDLVRVAFRRLPEALQQRALTEVSAWLDQVRSVMAAAEHGVSAAPHWQRPLHELMHAEGVRRARLDDVTWPVWDSWAEAIRRKSEVSAS